MNLNVWEQSSEADVWKLIVESHDWKSRWKQNIYLLAEAQEGRKYGGPEGQNAATFHKTLLWKAHNYGKGKDNTQRHFLFLRCYVPARLLNLVEKNTRQDGVNRGIFWDKTCM